ncbi:hypothetical protein [Sedimenticola selenatireducens]|uniref:Uncharacterized protein n=1 Tax=Sedimenticola selenatireducens TaxID=191960 RepID=A0A557SHP5_9GAMM|nr:hypothetical protein [Sedimenticola selenatireducens]TVO76938.1 hypothetical protein FHP88_05810 [Sedimenticola selenatireducens]TVT64381.1 MAG: hypothetical protein FHK78_09055 [Sedimenticola selenatireducens]
MNSHMRIVLVGFMALLLTGCMSAQALRDERIEAEQPLFNSYPSAIQKQIRLGQIDIGFTKDMVRLAWGVPDQIFRRTTRAKESVVWSYTQTRRYPHLDRMSVPIYFIDSSGRQQFSYHSVWVNRDTQEQFTVARVEFARGKVSAIEQLNGDE